MRTLQIRKTISKSIEAILPLLTEALKKEGFGVLTRIDFHQKMKEALGKEMQPTIILGACHPLLAYQAYTSHPEVLGLLPCNIVIRTLQNNECSIEITKPTAILEMVDPHFTEFGSDADDKLQKILDSL